MVSDDLIENEDEKISVEYFQLTHPTTIDSIFYIQITKKTTQMLPPGPVRFAKI